jgi:Flp pilus assembly protein TadD
MSILSPVPSDEIATWYDEAFEARRAGNLDTAQSLLDRILTQAPKHAGALYSHGVLALESNQLESAQRWIERAIEVQPSPVFYNTLCIVQIRLGAFASAEQTVQRGLTLRPDSPMLHFNLGVTLERQGRLEDAAICYRRVLEFEPDNPRAHASLGDLAMALDVLDDAERHLKRAVALTPTDLRTRAALADTLLTAGRYEEAWPYYEDRWVTGRCRSGMAKLRTRQNVRTRGASRQRGCWSFPSKATGTACSLCATSQWHSRAFQR